MIDLHELEAIKRLKHTYFRALDTKDWPLMRTCLAEECIARYDGGKYSFDGRENIVGFLGQYMDPPTMITLHQAHHPEIDILSDNKATGIWYLQDMVIDLKNNTTLRGAGFYHDEYIKRDGHWQISSTGYERTFEEIEKRSDAIKLNHNRFSQD
ncbi:MAG TPA: nuclear transport factor 2 family protein [Pseudomonadales bacterium]